MTCRKCGATINQGQKFCNKCGTRITVQKQETAHSEPLRHENNAEIKNSERKTPVETQMKQGHTTDRKAQSYTAQKQYSACANESIATQNECTKSKKVAGFLALFLGFLGAQWFYLGKPIRAIVYLVAYFVFPWVAFISIIEGFFFLFSKQPSFDKYTSATGIDAISVMLKPLAWAAGIMGFMLLVFALTAG